MARVTLTSLTSLGNEGTFLTALNENFDLIASKLDELLSLTGEAPNSMTADLDMNGNSIVNVYMDSLPTSDPNNVGQLWNNAGVVTVSAG